MLEHIPNPYDFLCQLRDANDGNGLIYIKFLALNGSCENVLFDIFYEHVNYFRLSDFERMFDRVIQRGHFFCDQYLYVVADLASLREPAFDQSDPVDFPFGFLNSLDSEEPNRTEQNRTPVYVWGGASSVIFSLVRIRAGLPVDAVIDVNPARKICLQLAKCCSRTGLSQITK